MNDKDRQNEMTSSDRVGKLSELLDRFEKVEGSQDGERRFGIKAPYSDAKSPKAEHWDK